MGRDPEDGGGLTALAGALEDMFRPLRRYADFRGRARRREYWLFILLSWLLMGPIVAVGLAVGWWPYDGQGKLDLLPAGATLAEKGITAALIAVALALFIPWLAVQVRRLHDGNRGAWNLIWNAIPWIGSLVLFVLMILPGTEGPNRYGRDPTEEVDEWGRIIEPRRPARDRRDRFGPA